MTIPRLIRAAALPLALAACVADEPVTAALRPTPAFLPETAPTPQPRYASYACEGNVTLNVENFQTSALFIAPGYGSAELPALPGAEGERFRADPYALVLEGDGAQLSRDGRPTLRCRR